MKKVARSGGNRLRDLEETRGPYGNGIIPPDSHRHEETLWCTTVDHRPFPASEHRFEPRVSTPLTHELVVRIFGVWPESDTLRN
jgi:hypothetical protein